ncbi:membrane protein insertase YidC [Candidatus Pelagibacter sp. RS40]|uniref:membrane protein insertase YidC n=1 Tax=Candidatus Pelagibacter sp. RS40 TaxID=1977865 RepID=UPI000A15FED5|nr:membrane protein insertase YidC [Candidatus Pelagibacter sp. RS40]ARJ49168.1 membrane protein insertase YidC [Candidatus Pelagibacter sp. RS40]
MDSKNVIAAISLSAAVIIIYGLFFAPPPPDPKKINNEKNNIVESTSEAPSLDQNVEVSKISRNEAIKNEDRVQFENSTVIGSISLVGGSIDDLTFKKYTNTLNGDDNVILLNPKKVEDGYYIETGWATANKNINLPNSKTIWTIEGNNKLTPNSPIKLSWTNDQNIKFIKDISIDDQYLFKVNQTIINNSEKTYNFYPYGQIIRNLAPEIIDFFILHEGLIGVFDDQLVEEDYDDIEEKKFSINADKGWLGITDKYWITSLIPQENRKFRTDFDYKNKFRANFIETSATEIGANETKSNEIKIIIAAKEVDVIDGYAENLNISKYDLAIDWGWFYFLVKPLFFLIDYFFKLTGNFGIAIILITICIRIVFFPLANYSFKSMAKMKVLQPEMTRLKELHKEDKMKLQQEMMALYKKEKVNPVSGCLPIFIQIPFFFAIYKVLFVTLEMRHQPFYGWIKDLSERDPTSIFNLFGLIPWDPPSFLLIGVWPCLMGLSMYLQQKLNPTPPDPIQAKIFAFFPLFLTVILAPFPSGLVIYWTINNILTMAQQYVIIKRTTVKTAQ